MSGKVYLVGAGPGDYKLLTLKAKECIEDADVVVYDRLAGKGALQFAREDAELIYVGKEPEHHAIPQEDINDIILNKALEGKKVARVKGGDPFLFGRGGEEAEILRDNGIEFEIIPGITSAIAVPAYAGIPVTHRDYSSSLHIITGHGKPEKEQDFLDYGTLAKLEGTLVFLMGLKNMESIAKGLILSGKDKETPAAVIEKGTTPEQRVITGNLGNITGKAGEYGVKSPAVIVVGDVVKLEEKLRWLPKGALWGKRIAVTRAREQARELAAGIEEQGGEVILFPTIKIAAVEDQGPLEAALRSLNSYRWIMFTSANGVKAFFDGMKKRHVDIRSLHGIKLCAVGGATAEELDSLGLQVDFIPGKYTVEAAMEGLAQMMGKGERILLARGELADDELPGKLRDKGVIVDDIVVYGTAPDCGDREGLLEMLKKGYPDYITFTSPSTVNNFVSALGKEQFSLLPDIKAVCIGPVTAKAAADAGMDVKGTAEVYTVEGLIYKLVQLSEG